MLYSFSMYSTSTGTVREGNWYNTHTALEGVSIRAAKNVALGGNVVTTALLNSIELNECHLLNTAK